MRLADLDELLNKAVNLEDIALKQVNKYDPSKDPLDWAIWMSVLVERTVFKEFLMDAPTVDALEVVRCKDCKHRDEYECNHIMLGSTKCGVTDEWFCADGERREK